MQLYERKYIWQLPVRLWHWMHFASMVVLSVTGYYIGAPFVSPSAAFTFSAEGVQIMSVMRFVHFVAAAVLTLVVVWRLYWFFVGNEYAHWRRWVPATSRSEFAHWLRQLREQARYYLFLRRDLPEELGHKPLASIAYIVSMVLLLLQVFTGWALYGEVNPRGWAWQVFGWVFSLAGRQWLRYLHHALMWALIAFFIVHVYMAIRDEVLGSTGTMTAMVSGYKYEAHHDHD
ncbi:MAG: Ni/Fe-hydrogenase, b-type cytochrome subunit [Anaerolineae bacterium]